MNFLKRRASKNHQSQILNFDSKEYEAQELEQQYQNLQQELQRQLNMLVNTFAVHHLMISLEC
jgi:hypothetical protein